MDSPRTGSWSWRGGGPRTVWIGALTGASPSPGITFKLPEFKEHDFRTPPKFLTPLPDRVVVAGYTAALNCAVRGHPKVPCARARVCMCVCVIYACVSECVSDTVGMPAPRVCLPRALAAWPKRPRVCGMKPHLWAPAESV